MLKNRTKLELCGIENRVRENLVRLRTARGMSVAQLAQLSNIPYISRVEAGTKNLGKEGLTKVAKALEVDISEFFRPLNNSSRAEQLLQVFERLSAEGQALLIETAKSVAAYEIRRKWRE